MLSRDISTLHKINIITCNPGFYFITNLKDNGLQMDILIEYLIHFFFCQKPSHLVIQQ